MFERPALALAKLASRSPAGPFFLTRKIVGAVPGLREYPVHTRYGPIVCDLSETVCYLLLRDGEYRHWRADEGGLARVPLNKDSVVLDIGANIGVTARMFAARAGQVHAFEPSPRALRLLRANAGANVTIHPVAVGDEVGTVKIAEEVTLDTSYVGDKGIEVKCVTVDSLNLKPDFIKIDVEGYEHRVLRGAAETIRCCRPVIMFEALGEAAREYLSNIILGISPSYEIETLPSRMNNIAWPK